MQNKLISTVTETKRKKRNPLYLNSLPQKHRNRHRHRTKFTNSTKGQENEKNYYNNTQLSKVNDM